MGGESLLSGTIKKTLRHSFIYGLGASFSAVVAILLIPLYTRRLSPDDYGVYSLIGIIFTLLIFVYDFGMINALFRWIYNYKEEDALSRRKVSSTALIFLSSMAAILTLVFWIYAGSISAFLFGTARYVFLIRLMLVAIFLQSLTWVPLSLLRIKEKPVVFISIVMSGMALMIIANFVLFSFGEGLRAIYEAYIIGYLYMAVILFFVTRREFSFVFSAGELKGMLKFGLPFFPVLFFSWIIDFSGRYFLGKYANLHDVGLYSIGFKAGQLIYMAEKTFAVAWMPIMLSLVSRYPEQAQYILGKVFTYFVLAGTALCLLVSVFGREILHIFTSPLYYGAVGVIPIIALSYLLYGIYTYMLSGLIIRKNINMQPAILFVAAAAGILLNIMLIPKLGMNGAAYATAASYFLAAALTCIFAQRLYRIPVEVGRLVKMLLSSVVVYYLGTLIGFHGLAISIFFKIFLFLLFFVILYITGFFKPGEISKIKSIFLKAA